MSAIVPIIKKEIENQFKARGYVKQRYEFVKQSDKDGYLNCLSCSFSTYKGLRTASIYAAVCNLEVERIYGELLGGKYVNNLVHFPIVNKQIGYIMPENKYYEWYFYDNQTDEQLFKTCKEMFDAIDRYTPPFFDMMSDLQAVKECYENNSFIIYNDREFFVLLIIYLLEGNIKKGLAWMEDVLKGEMGQSERYQRFYENYKKCFLHR